MTDQTTTDEIRERDERTADHVANACAELAAALAQMPNSKRSHYSGGDAARVSAMMRDVQLLSIAVDGYLPIAETAESVRERVREALRDAHRHDSAADAVEYVSDVVGWAADEDPEL